MRLYLLIVLYLFSLTIVACSSHRSVSKLPQPPAYINYLSRDGQAGIPERGVRPTPSAEKPYYALNLRLNNGMGLPLRVGGIYWLSQSKPLSVTFSFTNGVLNERKINIFCLLNYVQVPCRPESTMVQETIQSGEEGNIPLMLPAPGSGMHKVTIVAASYLPIPESIVEKPDKLGELIIRSNEFVWAAELTVFSKDWTKPQLESIKFSSTKSNFTNAGNLRCFVSDDPPPGGKAISHPNINSNYHAEPLRVTAGSEVQLYLYTAHSEEASSFETMQIHGQDTSQLPFVLTPFLNTQQIVLNLDGVPQVNDDGTARPIFGTVSRGDNTAIPISFTAPEQPGQYSFYLLYKVNPFLQLGELLPQEDGGLLYRSFPDLDYVEITEYVVIDVVPAEK